MAYYPSEVPEVKAPTVYTINLENFRGVDFVSNALNCESYRSPDMLNMIAGNDGFPVCRHGYELAGSFAERINGIYLYAEQVLVHHGSTLSTWEGETLYSGMADDFSSSVYWDGKLYLIDGKNYLCVETEETDAETTDGGGQGGAPRAWRGGGVSGYVPQTTVGRLPAGGGTSFEAVNLLCGKRTNTFIPDGTSKEYVLDAEEIDSVDEVYFDTETGGRDEKTEGTDYTVDLEAGKVTFTVAPPVLVAQRATVHITFTKQAASDAGRVKGCTIRAMFGASGGANTVFLSGNPDFPNLVLYSDPDRPDYFPDTNYILVGQDSSRVMGFTATGDGSMSIHKERNGTDPTVYYLTGEVQRINGLDTAVYRVQQGALGVGVIARRGFANLGNDALFVATTGVYADAAAAYLTSERYAQSRSYFINPRLMQEQGLADACAIEYRGYYYLAVGGHVYVADGVHDKAYVENNQINQYEYEWYYWDNMPVRCWFEGSDGLYFGAVDGKVYRLSDGYEDDGQPITVYWKSKLFDFGTITNLKTVKSVHVMPNPYTHSTINIDFILAGLGETVKQTTADIFDFSDLRFDRLSFETDPTPRIIPVRRKAKKIKTFQLKVWADAGEPLGLFKIAILYKVGGLVK